MELNLQELTVSDICWQVDIAVDSFSTTAEDTRL